MRCFVSIFHRLQPQVHNSMDFDFVPVRMCSFRLGNGIFEAIMSILLRTNGFLLMTLFFLSIFHRLQPQVQNSVDFDFVPVRMGVFGL